MLTRYTELAIQFLDKFSSSILKIHTIFFQVIKLSYRNSGDFKILLLTKRKIAHCGNLYKCLTIDIKLARYMSKT